MSKFKRVAVFAACAVFACAAIGCQSSDPQESEPSDVQLMETIEGAADETGEAPFYVLVVGNDSRVNTTEIDNPNYSDGTGRSDTAMLVRVDPVTYQVAIVSIPRDTATPYNGATVKFNEVYRQGGIEATMQAVKDLTGVSPQYYLDMGFVEFEQFVNDLGGVTANVPIDMSLKDIVSGGKVSLSAGSQDLDGASALVLARSRKQYADDQDACRQIQDRQLVEAAIRKVIADPANAAAHAQTLLSNADTNWAADDLVATVADFVDNGDKVSFVSGTGPYAGDVDAETQLWLTTRDEATWKQVIATVEAGGDPTSVVPLPDIVPAE